MYLVKPNFIKENPEAIVIDCRFEMGKPSQGSASYMEGHVKGAFFIDVDKDLTSEILDHGGRHPLKDLNEFTEIMRTFGIKNDSTIVIYDNGDLAMASRLWFMLKLIGLDSYMVEGGYDPCAESLEISKEVPAKSDSDLVMNYQSQLICNKDDVIEAMKDDGAVIVDARAEARYLGLEEPLDKIPGHIPTAINYCWKDNFEEGTVKSYEKIKASIEKISKYDHIIFHCGSGITGCVNMFFFMELGITSTLYAGSYSDWISYDEHDLVIKDKQLVKVGDL